MRVFFTNLGCKLNQAETEGMARAFRSAGHTLAASLEQADLHVVNSCTVTRAAGRESRRVARRGGRLGRPVRTVVTGCYAAASAETAARLAGVDLVVANRDKERIVERVHAAFPEAVPTVPDPLPVPYVPLEFGHARAMVKTGDGCNMRCAFCVIPFTRGREHSRPFAEVVAEVDALARGGYREVVVTGVQISSYRCGGAGLYELVAALLARTPVERLRLTSIAPWDFDLRLLDLFADRRLCRHLHLSLESGADATLRRMRRPYSAAAYGRLVARLRAAIPDLAVTTDVIVGFPGETREEFEASRAFVEATGFARTHVFPYSPREGTAAAAMGGRLPREVLRPRMEAMLATAARGERRFQRRHLGRTVSVLWEDRRNGAWQGLTDNYIRVFAGADGGEDLRNRITGVRLTGLTAGGMVGSTSSDLVIRAPLSAEAPPRVG